MRRQLGPGARSRQTAGSSRCASVYQQSAGSAVGLGKPGVPSLTVIVRHGGLASLLTDVLDPAWREKAQREELRMKLTEARDDPGQTRQLKAGRNKRPGESGVRKPGTRIRLM